MGNLEVPRRHGALVFPYVLSCFTYFSVFHLIEYVYHTAAQSYADPAHSSDQKQSVASLLSPLTGSGRTRVRFRGLTLWSPLPPAPINEGHIKLITICFI